MRPKPFTCILKPGTYARMLPSLLKKQKGNSLMNRKVTLLCTAAACMGLAACGNGLFTET